MMMDLMTVESFVDVAAIAFWPLVLVLVVLAWWWRSNKEACTILAVAAAAVFVVGPLHLLVFDVGSLWVLHDVHLGAALFGGSILLAVYRGPGEVGSMALWKRLGSALFVVAMLVYGILVPIQDFFLPRRIVDGNVTLLNVYHHIGPNEYAVRIGDTMVETTTRLFYTLRLGEHVRAEVGRGSNYIYRLDRNSTPMTPPKRN